MYRWCITFRMRNGDSHIGYYEGPEKSSNDVINYLCGLSDNSYATVFTSVKKDAILAVKLGEIESMIIKENK